MLTLPLAPAAGPICDRLAAAGEIRWISVELSSKRIASAKRHPAAPRRLVATKSASRAEAEAAVRTLIRWAGDDPDREGLRATPSRVVRAYEEWFAGYKDDPREYLKRTFEETGGYDEVVVLRDIRFESHCEHHMAPIIGRVHIGYLPRNRVVGISKLARLVEVYARRLQIQEKMTAEIATCLDEVLKPHGVAVVTEATHQCMTTRGVHKTGVSMVTSRMLGVFRDHAETRQEFLSAIGMRGAINVGERCRGSILRRASDLVGERAIRQRLGEMHAADFVGAVEIGERARDPQHAMIAARREPHRVGGFAQQREAARVRPGHIFQHRARDRRIAADVRQSDRGITRGLPLAGGATRSATSRLPSAGGGRMRSAAVTAGTSMCRSMRSSSGPEMRA